MTLNFTAPNNDMVPISSGVFTKRYLHSTGLQYIYTQFSSDNIFLNDLGKTIRRLSMMAWAGARPKMVRFLE